MTDVLAEITANVWQVRCEVGQVVAEGHELVILESMKMEIPVEADSAGKILKFLVAEGDVVDDGTALAELA